MTENKVTKPDENLLKAFDTISKIPVGKMTEELTATEKELREKLTLMISKCYSKRDYILEANVKCGRIRTCAGLNIYYLGTLGTNKRKHITFSPFLPSLLVGGFPC